MSSAPRQLVLLSTYRPSSKYRVSLGREEAEAFLHGYFALWHPAVIRQSAGPPTLGSHFEFETPTADHLFAVPETPPSYQSADWMERQAEAGSRTFLAHVGWAETLHALEQALDTADNGLASEDWLPFAGLGLGYLILEAFVDAQDHVNPLDKTTFYDEVRRAAQADSGDARQQALGQAAHQLHAAREVVYPSQLYQAVSLIFHGSTEDAQLESWLRSDVGVTLAGAAQWLHEWTHAGTGRAELLRAKAQAGELDVWCGPYREQEDALLPAAAWQANLQRGLTTILDLTGIKPQSHGRYRYGGTPALPAVLSSLGLQRSFGFSYDGGTWPHAAHGLSGWRGPEGQLLESCNRKPEPLDDPATAFHLGLLLYECTTQDYVGWLHLGTTNLSAEVPTWFRAWMALHRLAPVFGQVGTLASAIREIPATEQYTPPGADDFQSDYLLDLTGQGHLTQALPNPISRFAHAAAQWRDLEAALTLHALRAAITPLQPQSDFLEAVQRERHRLLNAWDQPQGEVLASGLLDTAAQSLAERLLSRSTETTPGYLVFNPCSFSRKVVVHLPEAQTLLPAPAWASQPAEVGIDAVVDVPPLGFAWVPCAVAKGAPVRMPKQSLVEGTVLRNEYVHVDIDPLTGGIRSIRDAQKLIPRLGQQLAYGPGATMRCREVSTARQGLAVGEITTTGDLVDAHGQVLARFTQRVQLFAGRKPVELTIRLELVTPLQGYPWHAYYAVRWAWRDVQTRLSKSVHASLLPSHHTRPETPGFIELEMPAGRTAIFSRGLPFWQRHGQRMLDTLLLVEGESARDFHLAVTVDDDLPHLTEQDLLTPGTVVPTTQGPPPAGSTGWLFFVDAPSVRVEAINLDPDHPDSVIVQLVETFGYATEALLQCPRPPTAATLVDAWGQDRRALTRRDDGINLHVGCYETQYIRVSFAPSPL